MNGSEENRLGGRIRRYARVSTAVGGIAARLATVSFRLEQILHFGVFLIRGEDGEARCALQHQPRRGIGLIGKAEEHERADESTGSKQTVWHVSLPSRSKAGCRSQLRRGAVQERKHKTR